MAYLNKFLMTPVVGEGQKEVKIYRRKSSTMKGDPCMWRKIQMLHSASINVKIPSSPFMKAVPSMGYDMSENILHVCYKYVDTALSRISQWILFYLLK